MLRAYNGMKVLHNTWLALRDRCVISPVLNNEEAYYGMVFRGLHRQGRCRMVVTRSGDFFVTIISNITSQRKFKLQKLIRHPYHGWHIIRRPRLKLLGILRARPSMQVTSYTASLLRKCWRRCYKFDLSIGEAVSLRQFAELHGYSLRCMHREGRYRLSVIRPRFSRVCVVRDIGYRDLDEVWVRPMQLGRYIYSGFVFTAEQFSN